MMSVQCVTCLFYRGLGECEAFPGGIPQEIFTGERDHTEPIEGDNGIQWKPLNEGAKNLMEMLDDNEGTSEQV